jgi:tetratricopeptide (TPR) repeat protein
LRRFFRTASIVTAVSLGALQAVPALAEDRGLAGSYLAARQASMFNDYKAASGYFLTALRRDGRNPALLESAILSLTNLGRMERAVPIARQMETYGINSQIAQMILLADQLKTGQFKAALDDLAAGRSVGPLVDGLVKAWGLMALEDTVGAMAAFDEAAQATGLQAFGMYHKALALAMSGDFEGADRIMFSEARGPLRMSRRGVYASAQVLSQLDRNEDAAELIRVSFGNDLDLSLSDLLARLDAGEKLPFSFVQTPTEGLAEIFYTVAGALRGEASGGYTLMYSRIAEQLRPDHTDAILLTAALLEAQDQYELATEAYDRVSRDDPAFHSAELGRAEALRRSGDFEAATEVLQQLTETHGSLPVVFVTLGDILRQRELYEASTEAYDKAVALFDAPRAEQWIVYYARGITHERRQQWDQAEADFRNALVLQPGQPQVLNYLGYSFVERGVNFDEALAMIEQAVAGQPDSGYITDSLGWVLYRLGRYSEAVGHMERAAELMPVDSIVNDHLGDVYWAVGRHTEARFQWHRALSFDPEEAEAERIRRKLEVGLDVVLQEAGEPPLDVASTDDG